MIDATQAESLPLDARAIEAGLGQLWQLAADGSVGGVVHASSLTLLALLLDRDLAKRGSSVLAEVAPAHPCRAIVVEFVEAEPRACLGAFCRPASAGRPPSCWEEIRVEGSPADLNRIMSVVSSLALPNLPLQVWWPGDPDVGSPLFRRVIQIAHRIIVDSAQFREPLTSLARYAEQSEAEHGPVGFADLGWRRLQPWRMLTAQFFDTPEDRVFLRNIESVLVVHQQSAEGKADGLAAAFLLVGWLASRLGWTMATEQTRLRADEADMTFDNGGRAVAVRLQSLSPDRSVVEDVGAGILSLELRAHHGGRPASYSIARTPETATTLAEVDGAQREAQVHLPAPTEADLLRRELAGFGRDRIYEDALAVVRLIAQRAERPATA